MRESAASSRIWSAAACRRFAVFLFSDIRWRETKRRQAAALQIDNPSASTSKAGGLISIIIPALNEAEHLPAALESVAGAENVEIIVVDGGSEDRTMELARKRGASVISATKGRARQMNAGAAVAKGGILLFLHADTTLERGFEASVLRILADPAVSGGAFRLRIDASGLSVRLIESLANFRAKWLGRPWGDQGLFVRADDFRAIGGYPDIPLMEDVVLAAALRRRGRIRIARETATTSGRRWLRRGPLRTSLFNQFCLLAYRCGVSPERIAGWRDSA